MHRNGPGEELLMNADFYAIIIYIKCSVGVIILMSLFIM